MTAHAEVRRSPDWDAPKPSEAAAGTWLARAIGGTPALVLLTAAAATGKPVLFLVAAAYGVMVGAAEILFPVVVRRVVGMRAIASGEHPRLDNLARHLASDLGLRRPALFVVPTGGPNAIVWRERGRPCIAATRSMLESFTRTELEAVVAFCLVKSAQSRRRRTGFIEGWMSSFIGDGRAKQLYDDVTTCAVTKYPIGTAAALRKAAPRRGPFRPLWWAPMGRRYSTPEERALAVTDL